VKCPRRTLVPTILGISMRRRWCSTERSRASAAAAELVSIQIIWVSGRPSWGVLLAVDISPVASKSPELAGSLIVQTASRRVAAIQSARLGSLPIVRRDGPLLHQAKNPDR